MTGQNEVPALDQSPDALLSLFDSAPPRGRYWISFIVLSLITALELADFALVAFLLAVLGPRWHLTYGQGGLVLYSGGVGSICGAIIWGGLSDVWGRKPPLVIGTFICGIGAGAIAFVSSGDWAILAALRFVVGFGLSATLAPCLALLVEITPTRIRTAATSFYILFGSAGTLLASLTSAALLASLGWRGVAMLGALTIPVGVIIGVYVSESVRWLAAKGRFAEARAQVAWHLGVPLQLVPLPSAPLIAPPDGSLSELYQKPKRFWDVVIIWSAASTAQYGVYLWGPTIVSLLLNVPVQRAAGYFVFVAGAGVIGKLAVSVVAPVIGRRHCGLVWAILAAVGLAGVAWLNGIVVGGASLLLVFLCCSAFGIDGSFANLAPYTVEVFGVRMGARASGLGLAASGAGKILGPLSLAWIAGTGNIISPHATAQAVRPAFLLLSFAMILVGLSFAILATETHGVPIALHDPGEDPTAEQPAIAC